jgi:hypothetical protein
MTHSMNESGWSKGKNQPTNKSGSLTAGYFMGQHIGGYPGNNNIYDEAYVVGDNGTKQPNKWCGYNLYPGRNPQNWMISALGIVQHGYIG